MRPLNDLELIYAAVRQTDHAITKMRETIFWLCVASTLIMAELAYLIYLAVR